MIVLRKLAVVIGNDVKLLLWMIIEYVLIIIAYSWQDDDSDFLVKLARLINGIGVQLILAWQKWVYFFDNV